ncbi:hypothetical protein BH23GEM9_BH23GEM9_19710 [soil metagenome]
MNRRVIAPLAGVLLACAAGAAHAQTDLRSIDLGSLVLDGERVMRQDASGRLASLPDGRYQLPRDASLSVSLGKIVSFTCPECPTTQSTGTIDGSMFKTNDSQCALEYSMKYAPIGTTPLIYPAQLVKWPMATRLDAPLGAYNATSNYSPYVLKNISSLRVITVKEKFNETTYELAVGRQRGYVGPSFDPPYIEWTDCGEPDPVVVAAREEKYKTELVAAAVAAMRDYLNRSR